MKNIAVSEYNMIFVSHALLYKEPNNTASVICHVCYMEDSCLYNLQKSLTLHYTSVMFIQNSR